MGNTVVWSCKRFDELSTDDLYAILQLRSEIFVVEQDCVYQDVDGFDQGALHVMGHLAAAEDGGAPQLICYTRLLAPGVKYERCLDRQSGYTERRLAAGGSEKP